MIQLRGKTKHGKERIRQHGEWWIIELEEKHRILLRSLHKTFTISPGHKDFDHRWVDLPNDSDFEIIR